jgi:NTP pyrophosphatase (non-canonical NTP hydrolase)
MTPSEYQELAAKTEAPIDKAIVMLNGKRQARLLHGAIGCSTESGELLDALKKHIFYQKPLDAGNLFEECGDIMWYVAIICNEMQWPLEEVMAANIRKLQSRYPNKFTQKDAVQRDLFAEQQAMGGDGKL